MFRSIASIVLAMCALLFPSDGSSRIEAPPNAQTYCIEVDITNQITTVYRNDDHSIVRQMICSTGRGESTPLGTIQLEQSRERDRSEWYYIDKYKCYVKFPTRIQGPILFHSLPYLGMDMSLVDGEALEELGTKASHGCVRLRWEDAQWISTHCPDGTTVKLFRGVKRKDALRQALLSKGYSADGDDTYEDYLMAACGDAAYSTLGPGLSGKAVASLQEKLVELGFMDGEITGTYDEATVAAVTRYQRAVGTPPTGIATGSLLESIETDALFVSE